MKPDSMDLVFHALASRPRRKILDVIKASPGCCVGDVCKYFEISRIAVIKHLRVLEQAQLIVLQKNGRRRELYFNAVPIQLIYDRWTTEYSAFWASKATELKFLVETDFHKSTTQSATRKRTP
jgi:predicted transcriptional regulator